MWRSRVLNVRKEKKGGRRTERKGRLADTDMDLGIQHLMNELVNLILLNMRILIWMNKYRCSLP